MEVANEGRLSRSMGRVYRVFTKFISPAKKSPNATTSCLVSEFGKIKFERIDRANSHYTIGQ